MTEPSDDLEDSATTPLLPSHNNQQKQSPESGSPSSATPRHIVSSSMNMINNAVSGAAFGAALVASGVYQPAVIVGQLELENWHMLQAFLAATASSTVFIAALDKMGYCRLRPRPPTTINIFSRHDGNIVGGTLLGAGMALAGACPGTVLAQVGVGVRTGYYALDGAILAGIFWAGILKPALKPCDLHPKPSAEGEVKDKLTVHERIKLPRAAMIIGFEALCAAAIGATVVLAPPSTTAGRISPIVGGLLIGLSQLWSLLTRRSLLGASTAYEEVANFVVWLLKGCGVDAKPKSVRYITFAAGAVGGAAALKHFVPSLVADGTAAVSAAHVTPALALGGGFLMALGARMANGCTSGHGISGMSMFSISSFLTIGTALAVGTLVRSVIMPALA